MRSFKEKLIMGIAVLLAVAGATVVAKLSGHADEARRAQLALAHLKATFDEAQTAPQAALAPRPGQSPSQSETLGRLIIAGELGYRRIEREMRLFHQQPRVRTSATLERTVGDHLKAGRLTAVLLARRPELLSNLISGRDVPPDLVASYLALTSSKSAMDRAVREADREYASRAGRARADQIAGATITIALLLAAFMVYFRRSRRFQDELQKHLAASREEAMTDALTGLGNRRALLREMDAAIEAVEPGEDVLIVLYDLDGFKGYNDTFGHPAGDALLARLGANLRSAVEGSATAYRLGGDEFCLLARGEHAAGGTSITQLGADALVEDGESFSVTASFGDVRVPAEAAGSLDAIRLADQRLYAHKASRRPAAAGEVTAVLMTALTEQADGLDRHAHEVAELARGTAVALGLPDADVREIALGATLHDVGKIGIPRSILDKPGPLDDEEWAFMRRHTLIGERIVSAAPSLAAVAPLVRSSHERLDGGGYPDGLQGAEIPLGARIIGVCDAFEAMVSERPYSAAMATDRAIAELESCAGAQFDPDVVRAFVGVISETAARPPELIAA